MIETAREKDERSWCVFRGDLVRALPVHMAIRGLRVYNPIGVLSHVVDIPLNEGC